MRAIPTYLVITELGAGTKMPGLVYRAACNITTGEELTVSDYKAGTYVLCLLSFMNFIKPALLPGPQGSQASHGVQIQCQGLRGSVVLGLGIVM